MPLCSSPQGSKQEYFCNNAEVAYDRQIYAEQDLRVMVNKEEPICVFLLLRMMAWTCRYHPHSGIRNRLG
ncbi:hypothetical protein AG1IA_09334 [Rhizoctonia solani AG-1 IA]|uniref:Uncharacterized protein n=1 Tax=Thanatephorus cucumeris (strain AG1-IA) TaxID=983506 RepID=L8WIR4_THACA|nr:hypothetical protein AG1IA_09334 [Rhizoctonia solani AG-1 IA]